MQQNNLFVAWIDWPHASDFRTCFGKTLVAIYFNEKHTQSVAQITMQYHESKDFFCFQFVVDQVLSISEYDLENGWMKCKQKDKTKNMAAKILILILFCFCIFWWISSVSVVAATCFNYIGPCRWL